MKIQAYVAENEKVTLKELQLKEIDADEIVVKIVGTGLCHTDLNVLHSITPTPTPIVLGHEGAGIVEKVGSGVTEFKNCRWGSKNCESFWTIFPCNLLCS